MFRRLVPVFLFVFALAAGTAHAMTFTLDDYAKTVVQPSSGFIDVDFTGTITIDQGFEHAGFSAFSLWTASGDMLGDGSPMFPFPYNLTGTIFTWRVYSTDAPGHYAYRSDLVTLGRISASECQIAGSACGSVPVNYSIDVVAGQAPEPASVALVGAALAGFAMRRRRR